MEKLNVFGGQRLNGTVQLSGSKNAALPILISSLLTDQSCIYHNVPLLLKDIQTTLKLLSFFPVKIDQKDQSITCCAESVQHFTAPYELVRTMRASALVLGPLLARYGKAKVSLPGGCAIGARPIDYHLMGLKKLGAQIDLEDGYVIASAKRLQGNKITFDFPSVGATENLMMAATLAQGETCLENCAMEPEIIDLANVLSKMGAHIQGAGTQKIFIQGTSTLKGCEHRIIADRIEAGTFLIAALMTSGQITVEKITPLYLEAFLQACTQAGAHVITDADKITLKGPERPTAINISTHPHPGFPTDLQAQLMAALTLADGISTITENIFENRFMHVLEFSRLGANIQIYGNKATITGVSHLTGAPLMATDIRASAGLVLAALMAHGKTVIDRIYHMDRGYEQLEQKLQKLGAHIFRTQDNLDYETTPSYSQNVFSHNL